ncbi:hypothetical protein HGA92_04420 [Candidatus Gracilibacteria bacterium]|nr:hypothetical protein [Candidatus Gracilibacteria bacterium]NUJ98521.1 hypothetical protein [Candidatus Gracilibacteria bacterium]
MNQKEKIIETRICIHCGVGFDITDKDLEFYEKIGPVFPNPGVSFSTPGLKLLENGKIKYLIPPPTLCHQCREQRRLSFANVRKLYKRKCDASGKDIISIYSPDKPYKVYEQEIWWSDKWEALDYGKDFDFSRSFFTQFNDILKKVPKISLSTEKLENSPYVNYCGWIKNCHLMTLSGYDEDCYYSQGLRYSKNSMDCLYSQYLENCYFVVDSLYCYSCFYIQNSKDCKSCFYSKNLLNCKNCIFCSDIVGKDFFFLNKQISRDEYEILYKKLETDTFFFEKIQKEFKNIGKKIPQKNNKNKGSENCNGEYIINSQNINNGYDISHCKDCKYVGWLFEAQNCYDVYDWGETAENCYDCYKIGKGVSKTTFSAFCINNINNLLYCYDCVNNTSNCFGCVGLKNKSYCILNKQYTKEEYEILVPKIIEHMMTPPKSPSIEGESGAIVKQGEQEWGEFFPSSLSPFGYNETVANEYYPINPEVSKTGLEGKINYIDREGNTYNTLEEAGKRPVFKYSTYEAPFPKGEKIIPASKLPENITDIPDDILNWAIECEVTKKPFRIIKEELAFYRKHNLPIPRRHPDQRHLDRMSLRNPRHLYSRNCDKCGKEIQTTYAPERPEIVYCEECYNREIY